MSPSVQAMIDQANRKTAGIRRKQFAKKANDQDHHKNLLQHVDAVMGIYHANPSLRVDNDFRAAMRELETAATLSRKRLEA